MGSPPHSEYHAGKISIVSATTSNRAKSMKGCRHTYQLRAHQLLYFCDCACPLNAQVRYLLQLNNGEGKKRQRLAGKRGNAQKLTCMMASEEVVTGTQHRPLAGLLHSLRIAQNHSWLEKRPRYVYVGAIKQNRQIGPGPALKRRKLHLTIVAFWTSRETEETAPNAVSTLKITPPPSSLVQLERTATGQEAPQDEDWKNSPARTNYHAALKTRTVCLLSTFLSSNVFSSAAGVRYSEDCPRPEREPEQAFPTHSLPPPPQPKSFAAHGCLNI
ncbi:hypothetical protein FN846DRAFT_207838 [Sphaerosporella brunnea]|uniref:Uncharacterized protein n=1 Tax=Sphaerosporella brunnea TaxID=1250544 RepID=A0A5J5ENZ0_9PEZI|nr:hypothetical protein FN846DRAFT_207838 [Sphaerosporella brunnea]